MSDIQDIIRWTDESQKALEWTKIIHDNTPGGVDILGIGDFLFEEIPEIHRKALELAVNLELEPGVYADVVLEEKALCDGIQPVGLSPVDGSKFTYQGFKIIYRKASVPRGESPVPPLPEEGDDFNGYRYQTSYDSSGTAWLIPEIDATVMSQWPHAHTILLSVEPWSFPYSDDISGGKYICHPKALGLLSTANFEFIWSYYWVDYFQSWSFYLEDLYGIEQDDIFLGLKRDVSGDMSYYSRFGNEDAFDKRFILQPGFLLPGYRIAAPGVNALGFLNSFNNLSEFVGTRIPLPEEPTPQLGVDHIVTSPSGSYGIQSRVDFHFNKATEYVQTGCVLDGGVGVWKYATSPGDSGVNGSWSLNVAMCARQIPEDGENPGAPWYFPYEGERKAEPGITPILAALDTIKLMDNSFKLY